MREPTDAGTGSMRDGRFWLLLVGTVILLLLDLVWRPLFTLPFLPVPMLLAAVYLPYRAVRRLAVLAIGLAVASAVLPRDLVDANYWLWLLAISISALLAVWMARVRDEAQMARKPAMETLAESERRYRLLAENESSIVYTTSVNHTVTYISPSVTRALGWLPEEMVGHSPAELIHPDDLPYVMSIMTSLDKQQPVEAPADGHVARMRDKSGNWVWVANRAALLKDAQGVPVGLIGSLVVVNELVQAQVDASAGKARLRAVLNTMLDALVLLAPVRDATGTIVDFEFVDANPAALAQGSLTLDALIGQRLSAHYPAVMGTELFDGLTSVIDEKQPMILEDWPWPRPHQHRRARHFDLRAVNAGDCVSVVYRDVTERSQLVHRIAASEQELRLILENSGDVVYRANSEGRCEFVTASITELLGWSPEEFLGRTLPEFVHQDDRATLQLRLAEISSGQAVRMTVRLRSKGGDYRWIAANVRPLWSADGRLTGRTGSWRDVSELVEAQQELIESERRYRLLAEHSSDVILLERDGVIDWVSPSLDPALGWDPADWTGRRFEEFTHPGDTDAVQTERLAVEAGGTRVVTIRARQKHGGHHWIEVHAGPVLDDAGEVDGVLASFRVVDAEVMARQQLDMQARFDSLTGLMNRNEIFELLGSMHQQRHRAGQETAVLFCDVDEFKFINDSFGHAVGDEVLRALANRIRSTLRREDAAARVGGDELLIVLTGIHSLEGATAVAEKIRQAAAAPIALDEGSVQVTLSIGITLMGSGESVDEAVARADEAMYDAKRSGRNRVIAI